MEKWRRHKDVRKAQQALRCQHYCSVHLPVRCETWQRCFIQLSRQYQPQEWRFRRLSEPIECDLGRTCRSSFQGRLSLMRCVCTGLYYSGHIDSFLQSEVVHIGLEASLLVKAPGTGELFVNFDPQILILFRETECMSQMGLEVSPLTAALFQKRGIHKKNFSDVKVRLLCSLPFLVNSRMHLRSVMMCPI